MNKLTFLILVIAFLSSCKESNKAQWGYKETVTLQKDVRPLSIAMDGNEIWVSDPNSNRLLKINRNGELLDSITSVQRPMNIEFFEGQLYVPEYLSDRVLIFSKSGRDSLALAKQLNAPASIDLTSTHIAIADFYNHRILLTNQYGEISFGEKGSLPGQFNYPTDVKLYKDKVYVADAYNNRVQVFDNKGVFEAIIGVNAEIDVASGLDVTNNTLAVTSQENNSVLIFDLEGNPIQTLTEEIHYPTDVFLIQDELWVANFNTNEFTIFQKK